MACQRAPWLCCVIPRCVQGTVDVTTRRSLSKISWELLLPAMAWYNIVTGVSQLLYAYSLSNRKGTCGTYPSRAIIAMLAPGSTGGAGVMRRNCMPRLRANLKCAGIGCTAGLRTLAPGCMRSTLCTAASLAGKVQAPNQPRSSQRPALGHSGVKARLSAMAAPTVPADQRFQHCFCLAIRGECSDRVGGRG